jgi:hypothetical protein
MYLKIFSKSITCGESGLFQTPTDLGRLCLPSFILPVAPPYMIIVIVIVRRKTVVFRDNFFLVIFSLVNYMSSRRVFCDPDRHSCESRNPENSVPGKLDARLRGHDE